MTQAATLIPVLAIVGQILASPTPAFSPLNTSSLTQDSSTSSACNDIYNCRTPWSIVYGCLITIFACTYLSFHPDVPNRTHTLWRIRATRICTVIVGFLVPEFMVARAAIQWGRVRKDTEFQDIKGWTRTHSYFVVMGGFEGWGRSLGPFRQRCGRGTETALESYPEMLKRDTPVLEAELAQNPATPPRQEENQASDFRILVTESEILDKSKGDPLGKLFTVLQTTWFIIQYLERWITHRPRTQLEVMTLAYAALNILIYALWWGKPLNIKEPIDVGGRASAVVIRRTEELRGLGPVLAAAFKMPFTDERGIAVRDDSVFFSIIFPVVGIIFGGVHCFAWWFPFPTSQERLLWRVCAVYCTATPCLVTVVCFIGFAPYSRFPEWINAVLKALLRWYRQLTGWTGRERGTLGAILPFVPYMACRIILVVLTFTSLRAPPPGIYEATLWPTFLPHFG